MNRCLTCFVLLTCCAISSAEVVVLENATIFTMDQDNPVVEALAFDEHGVLLALGSNSMIRSQFGRGRDMDGAFILPGFHDVHVHAVEAGITASFCSLSQFGDRWTYVRELVACAESQHEASWVMAAGVNIPSLLAQVDNPLALADEAVPGRPLLVLDDVGHGAWGNSAAMRAAGFDRLVQNPPGGILVRDDTSALTGVVQEGSVQVLVDVAQPATEWFDFARKSLRQALQQFAEHGITSVSDAGGYWPRQHERVWHALARDGELTVRAANALYVYPHLPFDAQLAELRSRYQGDRNTTLRFDQVKIYVDGILSQETGLMLRPYRSGQRGFEYFPGQRLIRYAQALTRAGFQLHFHATGDLGVRLALDAIQQLDRETGPHRITHLYAIDHRDIPRFAELGVVADLQFAASAHDPEYLSDLRQLIGERVDRLVPLDALHDAGAHVVLSSDWDADDLSPLHKLKVVLEQSNVGLEAALRMQTLDSARLLNAAHRVGSLEVGKLADIVVLSENLFELSPTEIAEVEVLCTLFEGREVFGDCLQP